MAAQRPSPSRSGGPRGQTRPGRVGTARRAAEARAAAAAAAERLKKVDPRAHPKLTGRAVVLSVVSAVLILSFVSSLQAYLAQRHSLDDLKANIATQQKAINDLETEKRRWKDPAYVRQQARERFGFVMPGETSYVVLDAAGNRVQPAGQLSDPATEPGNAEKAWWSTVWDSVVLAGDPPAQPSQPTQKINGTR